MVIGEAWQSLRVMSQRVDHVIGDVVFTLNVEELADGVMYLLQLSPLDEEGQEESAIGLQNWMDLSQISMLVWIVEEAFDVEGIVNA